MTLVNTLKGPVDSSKLGRVLVHEHLFTMHTEFTQNYRGDFVEDERIEDAVRRLNELKSTGIDTIIDLTVLGLGRYIPRMLKVAERTDLNIIVATGCYTFDVVPMPLRKHDLPGLRDLPDQMVELFVGDLTKGILHTDVKANELKCAIDEPGLTPDVERVLRAIGAAHRQTGIPITVHTASRTESGLVAQRVLAEEGVDLRDVIVGHCGDTTDLDYLIRVADQGSMLGMDRFGAEILLSTEDRVATIMKLIANGYLEKITVSHDCYCWTDMIPYADPPIWEGSYTFISNVVIPALRRAGLTEAQLDTILVDNPRRHFEGAAERFAQRQKKTIAGGTSIAL
jgi:phosphotriesterase-related protein